MMKSQHINSPFARALRQNSALVAKVDAAAMLRATKTRAGIGALIPSQRKTIFGSK